MPPMMPGMPPPPMPGPRRVQGGAGGQKPTKLIQAARLMLEEISERPELAKDVHPIVDALTKVIRQSVSPTKPPRVSGMDLPMGPTLDASPTSGGEEPGNPLAMMSGMLGR